MKSIEELKNSSKFNSLNFEFVESLHNIITQGEKSSPRNKLVKEVELETLKISPLFPIADFEERPFNWKYFCGELAWYLLKDRNINFINDFSKFWKGLSSPEGEINSNYGFLIFNEQLEWAKKSLIDDINSRQAVCFLNRPQYQYEGNKDFVCTMYINFWIRDNKLNMKVQMRSNDIFYGLTYDAPFFAFVQQSMWMWLKEKYQDLEIGNYYHYTDNMHFYERHFDIADKIVSNAKINDPLFFMLKQPLFNIKDGEYILYKKGNEFISDVKDAIKESTNSNADDNTFKNIIQKYFWVQ